MREAAASPITVLTIASRKKNYTISKWVVSETHVFLVVSGATGLFASSHCSIRGLFLKGDAPSGACWNSHLLNYHMYTTPLHYICYYSIRILLSYPVAVHCSDPFARQWCTSFNYQQTTTFEILSMLSSSPSLWALLLFWFLLLLFARLHSLSQLDNIFGL